MSPNVVASANAVYFDQKHPASATPANIQSTDRPRLMAR
jgi:hypothetical protein